MLTQIYYLLTNKCNLSCIHCIRGDSINNYMKLDDAFMGMRLLKKYYKNSMIILSGGEPTLHPDFKDILKEALTIYDIVLINTNGTINKLREILEEFRSFKNLYIQISIDGTQEYHDAIRGHGTWDNAMSMLNYLRSNLFTVSISTTVNKNNKDSVIELSDNIKNLYLWHISYEMPYGRADIDNCLTTLEWNNFVDSIIKKARCRLSIKKIFNFPKLENLTDIEINEISNEAVLNCGAGNKKIYVSPNMDVTGCSCISDIIFGNLKLDSIDNILKTENAKMICNYNLNESSPCNSCRYKPICNGGCIGMSNVVFGKIGIGDIRCEKVRKYYETL